MVTNTGVPKNYAIRQARIRATGALIPDKVLLEVTYRCNLRCFHCYLDLYHGEPQSDELSTSEWAGILKQLFEMGVWLVTFSGGEALCRPDILEIMSHAKEQGLFLALKSNGTLITEAFADRLKELGTLGVDVSLYGATPKTHEYVTGVAGSYDRTIHAIRLLRERKIEVRIESSIMNFNAGENKEIEKIATELGADYIPDPLILPKAGQPGSTNHLRMDDEQLRTFIDEQNWIKKDADAKKADLEHSLFCAAAKIRCAVSPQGEVFPCPLWRITLGNLRRQSFREIWYGEAARSIRSIGVSRRPVCANCELGGYCFHCPGLAHMENGGISGPSSEDCRLARAFKEVRDDKESLH